MKTYRLTKEELAALKRACMPVPYMIIGGVPPESPRTKAMRVWGKVAARVGCVAATIEPGNDGDEHNFNAEPLDGK